MPQFDFYSFSGQNFWFLLSFLFFYFFTIFFYLTNYSEMFKMRQKLIAFYGNENNKTGVLLNLFDFFISLKFLNK